jgi:hypothetical protein
MCLTVEYSRHIADKFTVITTLWKAMKVFAFPQLCHIAASEVVLRSLEKREASINRNDRRDYKPQS